MHGEVLEHPVRVQGDEAWGDAREVWESCSPGTPKMSGRVAAQLDSFQDPAAQQQLH